MNSLYIRGVRLHDLLSRYLCFPSSCSRTHGLQDVLQRHHIEVVGVLIPAQKPVRVTAPVHESRRDIEVVSLHPECRSRLSPEPNHPHRDKAHCSTRVGEHMEIHPEIVMLKRPFLVRNVPLDGDRSVGAVDILA